MSQQIAEFYAKITADTTQIQQSLTKLHDKLDKTKEKGEKTGGVFAGLKNHIAALVNPTTLAIGGLTALGGVVSGAFNDFQQRADEIRDLSIAMGVTAEQASITKETLADFGVETQDLQVAARALKEKGLSPTIETLAKLSDQFLAIEDPAERLKFAQDNLGKSYQSYLTALSQGSDVLLENASAVNKNLILTERQIKDAMRQKMAIDAVSDAWEGLKLQLGAGVGGLILEAQESTNATKRMWEYVAAHNDGIVTLKDVVDAKAAVLEEIRKEEEAVRAVTTQQELHTHSMREYGEVLDGEIIPSEEELKRAIDDATKANQGFLSSVSDITSQHQDYTKTVQDLNTEHANLLDEKKKLIAQGYQEEGLVIQEVNQKIDENVRKQKDAAAEFELAGRQRILSMLEQQLAVDGLDQRETDYLLSKGLEWGVYSDTAVQAARSAMAEVQLLADAVNGIPTDRSLNFKINVQGALPNFNPQAQAGGYGYQGARAYAEGTGGWKTVPPGYSNDNYMIGLTSGERFYVQNRSEAQQGSSASPATHAGGDSAMVSMLLAMIQRLPDDIARSNRSMFEKAGRR